MACAAVPRGLTTAADVLAAQDADEHRRVVRRWGEQVRAAWAPHHATVRAWNARALAATTTRSATGSTLTPTLAHDRTGVLTECDGGR